MLKANLKGNYRKPSKVTVISASLISLLFLTALTRSYMRIQTTLIGYELGELKMAEETMLEQRAQLQMELAKITTKEHLMVLSKNEKTSVNMVSFAVH